MGWKPSHKRIREHYNPVQTAAERRHEAHIQKQPCFGCGRSGSSAHHTLLKFEAKRWRRDHNWRLPVCYDCHQGPQGIHGIGNEETWLGSVGRTPADAIACMDRLFREARDA